jgi:RHS repeat-associated protein
VNGATETYTFDPAGNLTSLGTGTSLAYQDNRLASMTAGGITNYFAFDAGKRWRTAQAPSADEAGVPTDPNRTTFAYTGTGRLSDYKKFTAGNQAVHGVYTYDSVGQRTKSEVTKDGVETTTDFTYTGLFLQKVESTRTGGADPGIWSITYLYDGYGKPYAGVFRDLSANPSTAPVVFAMVTTDREDVVELLDANGQAFAAYRYDAWGNPLGAGNVAKGIWAQQTGLITSGLAAKIAQAQVLRYATYCYDSESGLYYLSCRHYDPATKQFLSKDLSRNDGEQSAYQYCGGNPVGNVDPNGYGFWGSLWGAVKKAFGIARTASSFMDKLNPMTIYNKAVLHGAGWVAGKVITHIPGLKETVDMAGESSQIYADKYWRTGRWTDKLASMGAGLWSKENCGDTAVNLVILAVGGGAARAGAAEATLPKGGVYSLRNAEDAVVRTGRTGDLLAREGQLNADRVLRQFRFKVEYRTDVYAEQRGLEDVLYNLHPEAQAANGGYNMIGAISPSNPNIGGYQSAASDFLARLGL